MNQQLHTERFTTFDLGLASALVALGHQIKELDRANPNRVQFVFVRSDELDAAVNAYWADEVSVPPQQYFNAMKSLKNQIYSH